MQIMTYEVKKAVIPAAGLGTRFLPATKAMPKEMLPVVDRPAIQYVVEEAVEAGLTDILMVTGRNKTPLENHFDRVLELEAALVYRGHQHVGDESFAVLLGDDIIADGGELLHEMIKVHAETGATVVAVQEVPVEQVSSYGVVAPQLIDGEFASAGDYRWPTYWVDTLVEKPAVEHAPSNYAIIGRYVLRAEAFEILERTEPGRGGEIQLTDALVELAQRREETGGVVALVYEGRRYDTGNKLEYIKANVELAVASHDLGAQTREWVQWYAAQLAADDANED
jgi:UTP--glucose-1-phosphate uridylyltransferase